MKEIILKYLGYKGICNDEDINIMIDECIKEVEEKSNFKYIYNHYNELFPFMIKNDSYLKYLNHSTSFYLIATTLGHEIDQLIKKYEIINMTKALVFDAVCSAYLEYKADLFEKEINDNLGYRFCPGYQNTDFLDNKIIGRILNVEKNIGISFLESGLMVPSKSMIGIIGVSSQKEKSCNDCLLKNNCIYKKDGLVCYQK